MSTRSQLQLQLASARLTTHDAYLNLGIYAQKKYGDDPVLAELFAQCARGFISLAAIDVALNPNQLAHAITPAMLDKENQLKAAGWK